MTGSSVGAVAVILLQLLNIVVNTDAAAKLAVIAQTTLSPATYARRTPGISSVVKTLQIAVAPVSISALADTLGAVELAVVSILLTKALWAADNPKAPPICWKTTKAERC